MIAKQNTGITTLSGKYFWLLLLLLLLFYNSYRYFFSYNMHTAQVIPLFWKILKYILLPLCLIPIYIKSYKSFKLKKSISIVFLSFLCFYILIINALSFELYENIIFDEFEYVIYFFLLSPIFFFSQKLLRVLISNIEDVIYVTAWIMVISNIYVYFNYLFFNRLPAHAYTGSLVRFGGLWDDPNGFAFFCVFLFFSLWKSKRLIICLCLFICIVFAFSFTSYILFIFSIIYFMYVEQFKFKLIHILIIVFIVVLTISVCIFFLTLEDIEYFKGIIEAKSGSMDAHKKLLDLNFYALPILNEGVQFSETWILSFLVNYMPISPVALSLLTLYILGVFLRREKSIVSYFIILFVLGMLFLPMLYVFPVNFIFIVFLMIHLNISKQYTIGKYRKLHRN